MSLVYKVFRCSLGHGDALPSGYQFTKAVGGAVSELLIGQGVLHLPDRLPFALLAAAVMAPANRDDSTADGYFLSLGEERFIVNDWWGREDDFRPIAAAYNRTRVELRNL